MPQKPRKSVLENSGVGLVLTADSGKQIRLNRKRTRLLFRKSDKVLLEFKVDEPKVLPSRGLRLEEGNIADFTYSADGKFIYIMTDDGILHFRSKNLDKDYVIDKSRHTRLTKRVNTSVCQCLLMASIWLSVQTFLMAP